MQMKCHCSFTRNPRIASVTGSVFDNVLNERGVLPEGKPRGTFLHTTNRRTVKFSRSKPPKICSLLAFIAPKIVITCTIKNRRRFRKIKE
jgi:hypothetical protein